MESFQRCYNNSQSFPRIVLSNNLQTLMVRKDLRNNNAPTERRNGRARRFVYRLQEHWSVCCFFNEDSRARFTCTTITKHRIHQSEDERRKRRGYNEDTREWIKYAKGDSERWKVCVYVFVCLRDKETWQTPFITPTISLNQVFPNEIFLAAASQVSSTFFMFFTHIFMLFTLYNLFISISKLFPRRKKYSLWNNYITRYFLK